MGDTEAGEQELFKGLGMTGFYGKPELAIEASANGLVAYIEQIPEEHRDLAREVAARALGINTSDQELNPHIRRAADALFPYDAVRRAIRE